MNTAPYSPPATSPPSTRQDWAKKLFSRSPLKQQKLKKLSKYLGNFNGKACLDIGSDNGVISLLLREQGGTWTSADLIPETVTAIRELVGERVFQIDGRSTDFSEAAFDTVAIVDFLEHIESDREFIKELSRILKPGGTLVVNVPNPREGLIRRIRFALGQTDVAHGHVRPGYTVESLRSILDPYFVIEQHEGYNGWLTELVDTVITAALDILKGGRSKKGTVVTTSDLNKMKKMFSLYSLIYPALWLAVTVDSLLPFCHRNMLIVRAQKRALDPLSSKPVPPVTTNQIP